MSLWDKLLDGTMLLGFLLGMLAASIWFEMLRGAPIWLPGISAVVLIFGTIVFLTNWEMLALGGGPKDAA
jgi:hypothetical protein